MQQILLVEDDPEIAKLIHLHFDPAKYELVCSALAQDAKLKLQQQTFHLVILDITLPDGNGIELCRHIRLSDSKTPVLMLTSHGDESDKVLALELGADDYITKPFGVLELMARVKAIMRRSGYGREGVEDKEIAIADLFIDRVKKKATLKGTRLDLTIKEFDLLTLLAGNPGKTFTRQEMLQHVWGFAFEGYEHTVTSHINRLRLKIEKDVNHPQYILTAWGAGYRFRE